MAIVALEIVLEKVDPDRQRSCAGKRLRSKGLLTNCQLNMHCLPNSESKTSNTLFIELFCEYTRGCCHGCETACAIAVQLWCCFVSMSAGLSCVLILCIDSTPLCTSCCMKRYFTSMCFAFFDEPILVAMLLPLVLSVCMRMFTFVVVASLMKFATCSPSCAPVPIAYSSDSADDNATTACVLLPNCTTDPIIVTMNPLVDFLVLGRPAQSAST